MINFFLGKKYYAFLLLLTVYSVSNGQVFNVVVDQQGSGDYTTIQDALNSVPDNSTARTLIFVKKGTYHEKVEMPSTKINVSLIGEDAMTTVISYDDNADKGMSSADTYTFLAGGAGFYAENITFENTSGSAHGQALAIQTTGDTMVFNNCRFLGFQDTYYAHKNRQYNLHCYVEGGTDFIYGDATAVFDSCTINCLSGGQYITAPADTKLITHFSTGDFLHGLLFRYSDVTANSDVPANSYYLGRPWQPNSSSVYMKCKLGDHIKPEGWAKTGNDNYLSTYFAEYKDMNADGSLADTTQRVDWSYQVTDAWATNFYKLEFFLRKSGVVWNPIRITKALTAPHNLNATASGITWDAVQNAKGYLVFKDDSLIAITESNNYVDSNYDDAAVYSAKSVSANGNLSINSTDVNTAVNDLKENQSHLILGINSGLAQFSERVHYKIFTISGVLIESGIGSSVNINALSHGVYIIKVVNAVGGIDTEILSL